MSLLSLLYVSRSTLPADSAADAVADIITASRSNNSRLGVTGALLFTGEHFAQVFEGPSAVVDKLMEKIAADVRHDTIIIFAQAPIRARRFGAWNMAYSGPSQFVAGYVTRLLNEESSVRKALSAQWLDELLWEFARGSGAT
ncbi:MAG: BLUF domain-containing protein [Sphingomonadales bacterium]|nr:BLUF domain-containing protein [Sphingomonadales bacterium]NCQ20708.1 BLUF domain-containing protein [Sphingomonadales bacterium]NCT03706.1 BLUF domain-containing protein [Sphingomonadales bacterium]